MPEYDAVGTLAFFLERHRIESATTARVLSALPSDGLSYRPHPDSPTAGTTAWTIVRGFRALSELLKSPAVDVSLEHHPDHQTMIAQFGETSHAISESLMEFHQQNWADERSVTSDGAIILRQPLGQILWLFHVDGIHHRGQLSTYLRPLGAAVPSIYGSSGDQPRLPL
jgi:uncharacterized damage-inducible protein DinB